MTFPHHRKSVAVAALVLLTVMGMLSARPVRKEKPAWKNLKVMSKYTSDEEMDLVMESFNRQLGVVCIYCHVLNQKNDPHATNFESDDLPAKETARRMMRMTIALNRKYFGAAVDRNGRGEKVVWCGTCHHGLTDPNTGIKQRP